jgi:spore maturation protein CgeB
MIGIEPGNPITPIESQLQRDPRICMPVFSSFARNAFRTGLREAQDVLVECDDVDLIELEPAGGFAFKEKWMIQLVYHDVSRRLVTFNPGLRPVRLKRDYDMFLLVCPYWRDVWYANAIQGWQDHCRISVCWIDEMWANRISHLKYWLPILSKFDHVIVGIDGTGKSLSEAIGRTCHEMQAGADMIRFSPYPNPPERVIDVYSIGRRLDGIHQRLLKLAADKEIFYVHDTLQNGDSQAPDHREHRDMYARMAQRSRFFIVAPGKVNVPGDTRGQSALAFRYFEGSAAGAVLIGQAPDCESFRRHFDWPDSVIEIQSDGSDVVEVISRLSAEPERILEISRRNVEEALRRHDWVYRWKEVFNIAGLDPSPAMEAREKRLRDLGDLVREGSKN